jgi:hypothetical protein
MSRNVKKTRRRKRKKKEQLTEPFVLVEADLVEPQRPKPQLLPFPFPVLFPLPFIFSFLLLPPMLLMLSFFLRAVMRNTPRTRSRCRY